MKSHILDSGPNRVVDKRSDALPRDTHGARPVVHIDHAVLDRQDGLNLQDAARNTGRFADTSPRHQVFQRAHEKVDMYVSLHRIQRRHDVRNGCSRLSQTNSFHDHESKAQASRSTIIQDHPLRLYHRGCRMRTIQRSTHKAGDMNTENLILRVLQQPLVEPDKLLRSRLRCYSLRAGLLFHIEFI